MAKVYYNMNGINNNQNNDIVGSVINVPILSTTIQSGTTTDISSSVPYTYNAAMYGYGKTNTTFDFIYPGSKKSLDPNTDITLYACWEEPTIITLHSPKSSSFYFPGQRRMYQFTPTYSGNFRFVVTNSTTYDADLYVYYNSLTTIASDTSTLNKGAQAEAYLDANKTYYIATPLYGSVPVLYNDEYTNTSLAPQTTLTIIGQHVITYESNFTDGGSWTELQWHNELFWLTDSTPYRPGYEFLGWYDSSTGGNAIYTYTPTKNTTFYAHWKKLEYTMTIKPNGGVLFEGTSLETTGSKSLTAKFAYDVPTFIGKLINGYIYDNEPTKPGNVFLEWQSNYGTAFKNINGITMYFNGETPSENNGYATGKYWVFDGNHQGNVTITAQWRIKDLTIKFNSNYPTAKTNETYSQTFRYANSNNRFGYDTNGTKLSPTVSNFYKEKFGFVDFFCYGYKIIGWSTNPNATTPEFETFHEVKDTWIDANVTSADGNTINLYAIWDYNGLVRVYHDGEWKMALAYIYDGTSWQHTLPQIYNGKDWKLGI